MHSFLHVTPTTSSSFYRTIKRFINAEVTDYGPSIAEYPSYIFIDIVVFCVMLFDFYYKLVNFCACSLLDNLRVLNCCHVYSHCRLTNGILYVS